MADPKSQSEDLQQVLLLSPSPDLLFFGDQRFSSPNFKFLKAYESPLPLHHFLKARAHSVQAILSSGGAPGTPRVSADIIQLLPSLRLVVTTSAGLNHIDLPECRRRNISIATAATVFTDDVADTAIGLLIDVLRRISAGDRYIRQGIWGSSGDYPLGSKVGGKRIGIVGLGSIGSQVAKRLEAFGCFISYNSRTQKPSVSYPFYSNVCELAANNDVLIICCGLTDQTRRMINKEVLSALGKEGVIINIGRGAIIDEQELVGSLVRGEIKGAGLDVFENEPHVPKELFELDNVVLSPHCAVYTKETFEARRDIVVLGNLEAFFSNRPLLTPLVYD